MEEIPVEIWEMIISKISVLHHVSETCKIFHAISRKLERKVSSLDELKHFVECNYARGVILSMNMLERNAIVIFDYAGELKNKEAALAQPA